MDASLSEELLGVGADTHRAYTQKKAAIRAPRGFECRLSLGDFEVAFLVVVCPRT